VCLASAIGLLPILLAGPNRSVPQTLGSRDLSIWRKLINSLLEFVADLNAKKVAILLAIVLMGTAIIVSQSRGGTLAMLFGGVVSLLAYGMARQPKNSLFVFIPLLLLAGLLVAFWTLGDSLMNRFERVDTVHIENDLRIQHWQATWPATSEFGVLGSGLGTYRGVHRSYRTDPELVVFHYAENQYFQGLVEAGWPGFIIYLVAWFLVFQSASLLLSRGQSPTSIGVGLMGMYLIASQALASALDFGFYIPTNTLALAVMFGFLSYHAQALGGRLKKPSWLRLQVPSVVISTIVLVLFGVMCLLAYGLYQRASIDQLCRPRIPLVTRENVSLAQSTERIDQLLPKIKNMPTPKGLNYAAGMLVHRCRLQLFEAMNSENSVDQIVAAVIDPEEKAKAKNNIIDNRWNTTQLMQLQEHVNFLKTESRIQLSKFRAESGIQQNLPMAVQLLEYSREISPLQPLVHRRLAQIKSILGDTDEADRSMERCIEVAPMNPTARKIAGLYYLQSNKPELAAKQFRRLLELQPSQFPRVMDIVTGRSNRSIEPMSADLIRNSMLPDNPSMLYKYALKYQILNPEDKRATFERAAGILDSMEFRDEAHNKLLGDIRSRQGEIEKAVQAYNDFLLIAPHNPTYLYKRAQLLEQLGKLELAIEDADRLASRAADPTKYRVYARELRQKLADRDASQR
ncbi:O-antigen ligase family protein, partial [Mariniblastus sp.]|nr:O-antigen ligase family protein [Mariniblastus sp.]